MNQSDIVSQKQNILIVDDVKDMRETLSAIVEDHGFQAYHAQDAHEMMKALITYPISLILLDIDLPDLNGIEALFLMREQIGGKMPKVCFISSYQDKKLVSKAIETGGSAYLVKPIDPEILIEKIQSLLKFDFAKNRFAKLNVDLKVQFIQFPIKHKSSVIEISEYGILIRSDLEFIEGILLECQIPYIQKIADIADTISMRCEKVIWNDEMNAFNVFFSFVAIHESIRSKIRSLVVRNVKVSD